VIIAKTYGSLHNRLEVRELAGIEIKSLDQPERTEDYDEQGDAQGVSVGNSVVWRSSLKPGWSWERNVKPYTGMDACPANHREYVVAGRIRYRMTDGTEYEAKAGDHLVIQPGHAGEVIGDETCILIDW
jgi:hypothetical protein